MVTKTLTEFVTAWESGTLLEVSWAYKKPALDRVIVGVRLAGAPASMAWKQEVWDVGP